MSVELLTQERLVLDIVQDYLSKNRQFDLDDIIPYISFFLRRTSHNLNNQGIKSVLISLVKKNFLIEGSKLTRGDVLKNKKRKTIYNYILNHHATYFSKIIKDLGFSNHVVVWHLNILIKFNFIKKRIWDKHDVYFDPKVDPQEAKFKFFTSLEKSKIIIQYLRENDTGITKTKISKALRMHLNTISRYLTILEKFRVIFEEKIDNRVLYFLEENFLISNI